MIKAILPSILVLTLAIPCFAEDNICFEAESATKITAPMQIWDATKKSPDRKWQSVKGASGEKYLEIIEGINGPSPSASPNATTPPPRPKPPEGDAVFTFEVAKKGVFIMWCRVLWADECSNSLTIQLDDARPFTFGQDGTFKVWHWVKAPPRLKQLELSKGAHTVTVKNREDGIRLDQILFSRDRRFVPVDIEDMTQ